MAINFISASVFDAQGKVLATIPLKTYQRYSVQCSMHQRLIDKLLNEMPAATSAEIEWQRDGERVDLLCQKFEVRTQQGVRFSSVIHNFKGAQ